MMPLRRLLGFSAAVSGGLRCRLLSTAAAHQPWAMIYLTMLVDSPAPRASLQLAAPPCASNILVPAHLVDPPPLPDPDSDTVRLSFGGLVRAASADGLLLLQFTDFCGTAPVVARHGSDRTRALVGIHRDPDTTRFVLNPLSGQIVRLPDIDGTKKTMYCDDIGILTQSESPHWPPGRYAVAILNEDEDDDGGKQRFVMRRFLSETGKWDKLAALPSPLPLGRRMSISQEAVAFAGRLWWVDVSCGAVSADPFSDRPDLRFVELPKGSVTEPVEEEHDLGRYRRIGVSEGRLRYAEVSQQEPFMLSSFVLDDDGGNGWKLEHQVVLSRLSAVEHISWRETPRIGVVDPLNASVMHLTSGNLVLAVDMGREKALGCSIILGDAPDSLTGFLKPCVLPPWLGSCKIPNAAV
nr:unnamed protein product [Digitaria exilis]